MTSLPKIFIGSSREALPVARGIKANFEFDKIEVRIWSEDMFSPGQYTFDQLIGFTKSFDFGIFVWADDDKVESRNIIKTQPRDNVILEAGMFYSALGKERVFLFAPNENEPKIPSDLLGLSTLRYNTPTDDNFQAALSIGVERVKKIIYSLGKLSNEPRIVDSVPITIYKNLGEAKLEIKKECLASNEIKILSNKGLEFFGSDNSVIPLSDSKDFKSLKRLKIILLSPQSKWINRGLMALRNHETLEDFINELNSTHTIVELGLKSFFKQNKIRNSGIKYQLGEPYFRFLLTENKVFVSSYAENPTTQVKDLPVYVFKKEFGSLYGSLRKHFNDLWKNNSEVGKYLKDNIDVEVSAGGLVYYKVKEDIYIALVEREDGSWVLPKGHKKTTESTIEQSAIREVSEETGLDIDKIICLKKIDSYSFDETARNLGISKITHFFLMTYSSNEIPDLKTDPDHRTAQWWNIKDELLPFMFYNYQKILLSEAIKKEFNLDIKINPK